MNAEDLEHIRCLLVSPGEIPAPTCSVLLDRPCMIDHAYLSHPWPVIENLSRIIGHQYMVLVGLYYSRGRHLDWDIGTLSESVTVIPYTKVAWLVSLWQTLNVDLRLSPASCDVSRTEPIFAIRYSFLHAVCAIFAIKSSGDTGHIPDQIGIRRDRIEGGK